MLPKTVTLKLSGDDAVMLNNAFKGYQKLLKNYKDGFPINLPPVMHVHGENTSEMNRIAMYIDTVIKAESK